MSTILQASMQMGLSPAASAQLRPEMTPQAAVQSLLDAGEAQDALKLLARLLPKRYAVAWLCQCARDQPLELEDKAGASLAEKWVREPTESNRRAAYEFATQSPATTTVCWSTASSMGPQPSVAVMEAILAGDMERAKQVSDDLAWANEPGDFLIGNPEVFASYNIQFEKIRINAAGYCNAGPVRSPYDVMPDDYAEAARECGRRWAQICQKYARVAPSA